ncbi:MAG: ketoacyl-ACP synthase III [Spirochaetaceae bacterium]|nr:ketoacyl-ACP synthase III [Spirochaetaceae bacterium]
MKFQSKARVTALGAYVPEKKLTNQDLEKMVDTNDEWIVQRTGITERRLSAEDEFVTDLAVKAVENLVERFPTNLSDIDLIIAATITPDYVTPSVAAVIHGRMDFPETTGVMDLNSACAGFVYALQVANAMVTSGQSRKVLIIAAEVLSKITDYSDRNTCILFGDGAGAAIVELDEENPGFLGSYYGSNGKAGNKLYCTNISKKIEKEDPEVVDYLYQDGRAVYTFVIRTVPASVQKMLLESDITAEDIDWFVPHSANLRMIQSIGDKLGFRREQALTSLENFGNTSSATIPLALWLALNEGKLKRGDKLALYGFGGGLTHAGVIIEW